ncbi:hypothetical protein GTR04_7321 [Trichophyton interdigitale]|nr:hypothetical protein GTR04_7321 [Trichophyton interdigitale]
MAEQSRAGSGVVSLDWNSRAGSAGEKAIEQPHREQQQQQAVVGRAKSRGSLEAALEESSVSEREGRRTEMELAGRADEGLRTRDRGSWVDGVSAAAAAAAAAGGASWMDEDAAWARDMVIEVTECWTLTRQ